MQLRTIVTDPETGLDEIVLVDSENIRPMGGYLASMSDDDPDDDQPWLQHLRRRDSYIRSHVHLKDGRRLPSTERERDAEGRSR